MSACSRYLARQVSAAQGPISNRGYGPYENDQISLVRSSLTERERMPDRSSKDRSAFTIMDRRAIARRVMTSRWRRSRYQGYCRSRMVVVFPNLESGALEAVRAYPNAGSWFTFTGTFDFRAQKRVAIGNKARRRRLRTPEICSPTAGSGEYVVRRPCIPDLHAIQPPRSIHLELA